MKNLEHLEQSAVISWCNLQKNTTPELELIFAIPNGGQRHISVAAKLKKEGVKSGVPDLFLPVAKNNFFGLFIELKVGKNKPTANQEIWISGLKNQGYFVEVCYGADEAIKAIKNYLKNTSE